MSELKEEAAPSHSEEADGGSSSHNRHHSKKSESTEGKKKEKRSSSVEPKKQRHRKSTVVSNESGNSGHSGNGKQNFDVVLPALLKILEPLEYLFVKQNVEIFGCYNHFGVYDAYGRNMFFCNQFHEFCSSSQYNMSIFGGTGEEVS